MFRFRIIDYDMRTMFSINASTVDSVWPLIARSHACKCLDFDKLLVSYDNNYLTNCPQDNYVKALFLFNKQ